MYHATGASLAASGEIAPAPEAEPGMLSSPIELAVVVVAHDCVAVIGRCLEALAPFARPIVVVDVASTDGTAEVVRMASESVRLLELSDNVGYGAGANAGIRSITAEQYLVVNADAWPLGLAVDTLLAFVEERPRVGVAGPRLVSGDGKPLQSSFPYPSRFWAGRPPVSSKPPRYLARAGLRATAPLTRRWTGAGSFLVGAVLLLRSAAIADAGAFDADFFMYGEDVDLCRRIQAAGWEVGFCADARFVHLGGTSTGVVWPQVYREQIRSHLRYVAKYEGQDAAEQARMFLSRALRVRGRIGRSSAFREASEWLAATTLDVLLKPGRWRA